MRMKYSQSISKANICFAHEILLAPKYGDFSPAHINSPTLWIPTGFSTIRFNGDTNYP